MDAVMAVCFKTEPTPKLQKSQILLRGAYVQDREDGGKYMWDFHPDRNQFLMVKLSESKNEESETKTYRKINIVLNWFEELKEKVPVP